MSIVDVHAHLTPLKYIAALTQATGGMPAGAAAINVPGRRPLPFTDRDEHVDERIADMDAAGVSIQVLSPPGLPPYHEDEDVASELAAVCNDEHASFVSGHPDRFRAFLSLPLPHVASALKEIDRSYELLGAVGVTITCSILDRSPALDEFLPIYEELDRRRAVVFFHPTGNGGCSPLINDFGFAVSVGTSLEDTMVALQLIANRIPHRFPNIRWVVPHFGGMLPLLLERLDRQGIIPPVELPEAMSTTLRRFFYDTVGHGSQPALQAAWRAFGPEQLLPGSDYPILNLFETYARTFEWIEESELPANDVDAILHRNAQALLELTG